MVLHVGFRRYAVRPLYSQNTSKSSNHVHKYERFIHIGKSYIATIYGPVVFGKVPCMFYKETDNVNGESTADNALLSMQWILMEMFLEPILVSTGVFVNTDVTRIIAKRIILSGHPFKIHKRSAVIRYMFFNPGNNSKFFFSFFQTYITHVSVCRGYQLLQTCTIDDKIWPCGSHSRITGYTWLHEVYIWWSYHSAGYCTDEPVQARISQVEYWALEGRTGQHNIH